MSRAVDRIRVAIDVTPLRPLHTGIETYIHELVLHLGRIDSTNDYTLFVNTADRGLFAGRLPPSFRMRPWCVRSRLVRLGFQQVALPIATATLRFDVVHSPSFHMPMIRGRARHLLSVHDMTFFSMPEMHTPFRRSRVFREGVLRSIRRADLIHVPSQATRQALLERVPDVDDRRVRVVPLGISPDFNPGSRADTDAVLQRMRVPERFILYAGTVEPRKNLDVLLRAYRRLIVDGGVPEHLLLAGRVEPTAASVLELANAPDLRERVRLLDFVARDELLALMRAARVFVYPSRYEGFGFPPLEAMACGTPVVATLGSALEENLAGAAQLVPPGDAEALADAMRRLLLDPELRARRMAEGIERAGEFRWEHTARRVLASYREMVESARDRKLS